MIDIKRIFDDGYFDNEDYDSKLDKFIDNLSYLIITIPFVAYYSMFVRKPNTVYPFSVGNYIHANYMHFEEEMKEEKYTLCNRYNLPNCKRDDY